MIYIEISTDFVGDNPLRMFYPSMSQEIATLLNSNVIIHFEKNRSLPLDQYGYANRKIATKVEVTSEEPLSETDTYELKEKIKFLAQNSFYRPEQWGEFFFLFYTATIIVAN